jgi:Flp pilus assembly protein TadG
MIRFIRRRLRQRADAHAERGTAVVEGALVFGIFMSLILGVVEFGVFFMFWSTGRNAAAEGGHELAIGGSSVTSDYDTLRGMRSQLARMGDAVDYVIIYRAKNINSPVPAECITQAELGKVDTSPTAAFTPYGVFQATGWGSDPAGFAWKGAVRPTIACNVYYPRNFAILKTNKAVFSTNLSAPVGSPQGLDKFWPGAARTDWITGPVDYAAIYIKTSYTTLTGIVATRSVTHRSVVPIEPKKSSR